MRDKLIRHRVRQSLPPEAFQLHPLRVLLALPLLSAILGISSWIALTPVHSYEVLLGIVLGNLYASLFFFGHEVGHGGIVRSRLFSTVFMFFAFGIFCLSPHLWRIWHNDVHHGHTNDPTYDPDNFGDLEAYASYPSTNKFLKAAPGSGHWLSAVYLPTWFTIHTQGVLWIKSRRLRGFSRLSRRRAALESSAIAAFWIALSIFLGPWRTIFIIAIPMLTANAVIMAYISTNHLLRPLVENGDVLATSMSIVARPLIDRFHFHFSHHVEHHLFPRMSSAYSPLVRSALLDIAPDTYLALYHGRALTLLFQTPRVYDGDRALVNPASSQETTFDDLNRVLSRESRAALITFANRLGSTARVS